MRATSGILAAAILAAAANAGAVEIYSSDQGWVYTPPPTVVYTPYHIVEPVVTYTTHVNVDVVHPAEPEPPSEFDDLGLIEVGAGYGGFWMPSLKESLLQAPRAHLALILDPVSVDLDVAVAKDLRWGETNENGACLSEKGPCGSGDLVQTSLGFAWRWNRRGNLHPIAGAGLEMTSLSPAHGDATFGFTAAARVGLIFEYPLPFGALEAGLDLTGHVKLVAQDAYPLSDPAYLTFGGYAGYRF